MDPRFTEFVRNLGEATDRQLFSAVWRQLRALLRSELKRRGLWDSPPSYLGTYGWPHWETPFTDRAARRAPDDALEELVAEAYSFIFVTRIRGLKAQLKVKPNIDGLVLLNLRHFLHERQKEHDPIGFRIFEIAHAAVCAALARGELQVLAGDPRVRNDTLLGFDAAKEIPAFPPEIEPLVSRWNDDLMPALITAKGADQREVCDRLRAHLLELPRDGIQCFRFKDLVDPLKLDARGRWAGLLEAASEDQDLRQALGWALPAAGVESRQSLDQLTRCVFAAIQTLEGESRTKAELSTLWSHLRRHAESDAETPAASDEEVLSQRRLALQLGIRRARLPELFGILRHLVSRCREQGCLQPGRTPSLHRESPTLGPPSWRSAEREGQNRGKSYDR